MSVIQGFKDDFVTLRKTFFPNEQGKADRAAAIARVAEERRKFDEEWDANTRRFEEMKVNARKLGWATHRVRLLEDYWWYHMLASRIPAGTEARAVMVDGKYHARIEVGDTTGYFSFTDEEVEVIEFLNER